MVTLAERLRDAGGAAWLAMKPEVCAVVKAAEASNWRTREHTDALVELARRMDEEGL